MKIFICTHKPFTQWRRDTHLEPLLVGAYRHEDKYGYSHDDTGENISSKNDRYCELTGLYWIWKNAKEDIVGLCHYRRYFDIDADTVSTSLRNHDIILPRRATLPFSLRFDYCLRHIPEDFQILKDAVHSYDSSYDATFDAVFSSNKLSPYNMFIASSDIAERYCQWLFGVLGKAEEQVHVTEYSYQRRVFGFMSERLMEVFVRKNNLKVKRVDVVNTEQGGAHRLKTAIGDCVRQLFFWTTKPLMDKQI